MKEQLKEALEHISDTYEDFITGVMLLCKTDETRGAMINYITKHEKATSSEVLDYYFDNLDTE